MKYDLTGYPNVSSWKAISLLGRIIQIADFYDAVTSPRAYRPYSLSPDETIRTMLEKTGFKVARFKRHWQSLELGYILFRMQPYLPKLSSLGTKIATALKIEHLQIPYWMGQVLVLANPGENE